MLDPAVLRKPPGALRSAQRVFDSTGGLHAAGLYKSDGTAVAVREDVGRHGADGVRPGVVRAGAEGRDGQGTDPRRSVRPSSLAAEPAEDDGISLLGFLRGDSMNVCTRPDRLTLD